METMACNEVRAKLTPFLFDELTGEAQHRLARHLGSCESCADRRALLAEAVRFLRSGRPAAPDPRAAEAVIEEVRAVFSVLRHRKEISTSVTASGSGPREPSRRGPLAASVALLVVGTAALGLAFDLGGVRGLVHEKALPVPETLPAPLVERGGTARRPGTTADGGATPLAARLRGMLAALIEQGGSRLEKTGLEELASMPLTRPFSERALGRLNLQGRLAAELLATLEPSANRPRPLAAYLLLAGLMGRENSGRFARRVLELVDWPRPAFVVVAALKVLVAWEERRGGPVVLALLEKRGRRRGVVADQAIAAVPVLVEPSRAGVLARLVVRADEPGIAGRLLAAADRIGGKVLEQAFRYELQVAAGAEEKLRALRGLVGILGSKVLYDVDGRLLDLDDLRRRRLVEFLSDLTGEQVDALLREMLVRPALDGPLRRTVLSTWVKVLGGPRQARHAVAQVYPQLRDVEVRAEAARVLLKAGDPLTAWKLGPRFGSLDELDKRVALRALGGAGSTALEGALAVALHDAGAAVRAEAARAAGASGRRRWTAELKRLLEAREPTPVRAAALEALVRLGEKAPDSDTPAREAWIGAVLARRLDGAFLARLAAPQDGSRTIGQEALAASPDRLYQLLDRELGLPVARPAHDDSDPRWLRVTRFHVHREAPLRKILARGGLRVEVRDGKGVVGLAGE